MKGDLNPSKNRASFGVNKPDSERVQVLLKTSNLLGSSTFFINIARLKSIRNRSISIFQLLVELTTIATWLGHVTMLFLGLINKNNAFFLIPKSLALAHSSSYLIPGSINSDLSEFLFLPNKENPSCKLIKI